MLISKLEKMLNISIEDVNFNFSEKEYKGKNWKSKLVYKNSYYDNAKLVRILISDYIKKIIYLIMN